jgi:hypothetical protein
MPGRTPVPTRIYLPSHPVIYVISGGMGLQLSLLFQSRQVSVSLVLSYSFMSIERSVWGTMIEFDCNTNNSTLRSIKDATMPSIV